VTAYLGAKNIDEEYNGENSRSKKEMKSCLSAVVGSSIKTVVMVFCPTDESRMLANNDFLFNDQIMFGKLQEWSINNNYEY
jgi:hypothetical protein